MPDNVRDELEIRVCIVQKDKREVEVLIFSHLVRCGIGLVLKEYHVDVKNCQYTCNVYCFIFSKKIIIDFNL